MKHIIIFCACILLQLCYGEEECMFSEYKDTYFRQPYDNVEVWGSVDECKNSCENYGYCWGFDYGVNQQACKMMGLGKWNPIDQFIRCDGEDCSGKFTKHAATVSPGGETYYFDLHRCGSFCMDEDSCLGFDYDYGYNACYIHTDADVLAQSKTSTAGDHYTRVPCDKSEDAACTDTFEKIEHAFSSISDSGDAYTVDDCGDLCLSSDDCDGFDFDNDWNVCLLNERESVNVPVAYARQDDGSFEEMDGVYLYYNGDYQNFGSALSLATCQNICLAINGGCETVLYDHQYSACWVFPNKDDMQEMEIDHYVKHCSD